jgi:ketosteroid isomerase-like protein
MSLTSNKLLARRWVDAINRRDGDALRAILSDDFLYSGMGRTPKALAVRWNREQMLDSVMHLGVDLMKKPVVMTVVSEMGEGNWVTLEMEGHSETKDGRIYANAYCFLYEIEGEKIKAIRDYCCTETAIRQRGSAPPPATAAGGDDQVATEHRETRGKSQ